MKLVTSLLETLAYFAKVLSISSVFIGLSIHEPIFGFVFSLVLWLLGYLLNKLELRIEAKRLFPVKHYDYIVLRVFGWIVLVATLISLVNPIYHADPTSTISQLIWSVYLIVSGGKRKTMYADQKNAQENVNTAKKIDVEL